MVCHYEYSTYNSNHKVLVNLQASNMEAVKSKSFVPFSQTCVFTLLQDGAQSRPLFLHSFNSGCYHHSRPLQWNLDGYIVWNAHNTVLGEEGFLICIVPVCYVKTGRYGKT